MKILNIITKEVKQNFRNKRKLAIMILFPIILMVILGTAFSKSMSNDIKLGKIKVLYTVQGEGNIGEAFKGLQKELKDYNVSFKETKNIESAKNNVQNSNYSCYLLINENNKDIKIYKNNRYYLGASFVEGILNTFVQRYNVINEIKEKKTRFLEKVVKGSDKKYIIVQSLNEKKEPRAIDCYGVTMTTLIILYSAFTGAYGMIGEKNRKTEARILAAPVTKKEIFIGKTLGALVVTIFQISIVIIFSKYVIGVNWGNNIGMLLLVIGSEIIMAVSMGIGVAFLTKTEAAMNSILNFMIPIMVFLGGGYVPLEEFNSEILNIISNFSPVRWINSSILNIVFRDNYEKVIPTIAINFTAAVIFLIIASMLFRREEA
ncbi:ABC transporter permease [Clostridium sp. ZS2-4]|uniref:ABC transporter permease n=1 Tax=Clostridium sp. ZS2-4 TaxID=2987703 RepID=UPI00227A64D0|nr:ABC transporter permease [Clostridium sp. ZS2-4]MCY6353721.1 ABC transporter permease [Clostridium sp. ZS2-4]